METKDQKYTPVSLVDAIEEILRQNDYEIMRSLTINGAEVDLRAKSLRDPFAPYIFIECTVQHVDVTKFGKDLTKLNLIQRKYPDAQRMIITSGGFAPLTRERIDESGIHALTMREFRRKFEKFDPYLENVFISGPESKDLLALSEIYERPTLITASGENDALTFASEWLSHSSNKYPWLFIVGEYGTGKTALSQMLLYNWGIEYAADPSKPIPFRLELRDFNRKFDADGLLHHFLDKNRLSHIALPFIKSLISNGRVVLILDGYDEMAQYMNARDRRACLGALATLSRDGARGIITSRPNFFSQREELEVLDALYANLERSKTISTDVATFLAGEQELDQLLSAHFLDRYEQSLRDLTPEQSRDLVRRKLRSDVEAQAIVLGILDRAFEESPDGTTGRSLAGKPVIITYLLDVVRSLSALDKNGAPLSEWGIYKLIVDKLMYRDINRLEIAPDERRRFLRELAVFLSLREHAYITEEQFRELVQSLIKLPPYLSVEERRDTLEAKFEDLRTSATLTVNDSGSRRGWRFSHNSLREFFLTEMMLDELIEDKSPRKGIPISEPMRRFAASRPAADRAADLSALGRRWSDNTVREGVWFSLLWPSAIPSDSKASDRSLQAIGNLTSGIVDLSQAKITRLALSSAVSPQKLHGLNFAHAELSGIEFVAADLQRCDFSSAWIDGCSFFDADLRRATFNGAAISECIFVGAALEGADFRGILKDSSALVELSTGDHSRVAGTALLGYLKFHGAKTDSVPPFFVLQYHPKFPIVAKISRKLAEQTIRQRRGLVQRGVAQGDVRFAEAFMKHLEKHGLIEVRKGREGQIVVTSSGRDVFTVFTSDTLATLPPLIEQFFAE